MNKCLVAAAMCTAITAFPISSIADDRGIYISADAGQSHFSGMMNNLGMFGAPVTSTYTDNDMAYRLSIGYQFDPYWGIETSYLDLGQANINVSSVPSGLSSDTKLKAHGWVLAGTGTIPISSNWNAFVRLGAVDAHVEQEVNSNGVETPTISSSSSSTDWKATYGAGISWLFAPHFSARLGWDQYRHLGNNSMGENNVNVTSIGIVYLF